MQDIDRRRRRLVKLLGAGTLASVAGCLGGDGGDGDGGSGSGGSSGSEGGSSEGSGGTDGGSGGGDNSGPLVTHNRFGYDDGTPITFWLPPWTSPDPEQNAVGESFADGFRPIYEEWAERNGDYWLDPEYQTNTDQMQTKLLRAAARGDAPAVTEIDSFWLPGFWDDLEPVDDVIDDTDDWFPFVKDIAAPDGEFLAIWRNTDCRALYYRKDLVEEYGDGEPPRTWDELVDVGTAIADGEDMDGFMYNGGRWEGTTFDNLAYFWAQGGQLADLDSGAPVLGEGDNYDALLNTFEWFKRTVDSGLTPERVVNIDDNSLLSQEALEGTLAMFIGGNWQIHSEIISEIGEEEAHEKWGVAQIPQPSAEMAATGTGGWTYGVFADGEASGAAKDLPARFADTENMGYFCESLGYLPTRPSVFEEREFFSEDRYMQTFRELLEDGRARPGVEIYRTISSEWQIAVGRVVTGDMSPKQAVDTMVENVRSEWDG
jgi:multiple sugar transport system substrate-binding protein